MLVLTRRLARPMRRRCSLLLTATTVILASACNEQDTLPTVPPTITRIAPVAAILGADVTDVPFSIVAINDAGQAAGTQGTGAAAHAIRWTPGGGAQDLGTLGGTSSSAYAINEAGQVAGASTTATGAMHAFLWTPGQGMQDLGVLPGGTSSIARGINDRGEVVGQSTLPPIAPRRPATHAFRWTPAVGMEDLGTVSQTLTSSIAFDINNAGQVVGRAFSTDQEIFPPTDPEFFSRAFLWAPGLGMRDLGDLGGGFSVAYAINDAGQVVGRSWRSTFIPEYGQVYHAFVWTSDQGMRSLGTLGNGPSASVAYGINEAGQVVGANDNGPDFLGYSVQAFLWSAADGIEALTPTTGISSARDINDRLQVVGSGRIATLQLTAGNNPPLAVTGGPYTGVEGSGVSLDLRAVDNDDVGFLYRVSFGDGSADAIDTRPPSRHTYADNGAYTLTLNVSDQRGGADTKTTTVTIVNVAPTIIAGSLTAPTAPIQLAAGSASAPIAFEFTDPAGRNDVYAAAIACGNGVVLAPTNIPVSNEFTSSGVYAGKGAYAGACTYASAGVYTVRVTVSDEDGGTSAPAFYRYVVVYDPDGGSTRGAGFYDVPGHAKTKAHFTFDAGFLPGRPPAPNGTVKFWVPGGQMDFESTAVEILVVSGNRAQFWGTGTLNGRDARFRITAVDGKLAGHAKRDDAVRVELWQAGALVYDTQPGATQDAPVTTAIDGGNIQIRHE